MSDREIKIMNYSPRSRLGVTTRTQLLELLMPMARVRNGGRRPSEREEAAFNAGFNEIFGPAQHDTAKVAVLLLELLFTVDRSLEWFACIRGWTAEAILREIIR